MDSKVGISLNQRILQFLGKEPLPSFFCQVPLSLPVTRRTHWEQFSPNIQFGLKQKGYPFRLP
jgi:hypothetical protein